MLQSSTTHVEKQAAIDIEPTPEEEEVPLRVLLVLLDEVFDLRDQGQWLRRQLTILLKQLAGDKLSRKVVETIDWLTSPEQVAEYIRDLRYRVTLSSEEES